MTIWLAIAGVAGVAALWLCLPLLRAGAVEPSEADHAVSIYSDQLDELDRDHAAGMIGTAEREAARREIARRAFRAGRMLDGSVIVSRRRPAAAVAVGLSVAAGAAALYTQIGAPDLPDMPLAARIEAEHERRLAAADPQAVAAEALARLEDAPDGFEKAWAEAEAYAAAGDYASAAEAYRRAAAVRDDPAVEAAYAEALTLANGNKVPPAAKLAFAQVLARDPFEPRARYYLALAKAQAQDFEGALADWQALKADSRADAPWMPLVRRDIVNMARFTGTDIATVLPDATSAERARAGAATDPTARIAQIEAVPAAERPHELWLELIRLEAPQNMEKARGTLAAARERFAGAPFVLGLLNRVAAETGLGPRRSGPDDAAVAAAADMTPDERSAMIDGMVAGLAARLKDQPLDPEGWAMLIRSYAVLDRPAEARQALETALAAFPDRPDVAERLRRTAAEFAIE